MLLLTRRRGKMFRRTVLVATTTPVPTASCTSTLTIQTFIRSPASVVSQAAECRCHSSPLSFNNRFEVELGLAGLLLVFVLIVLKSLNWIYRNVWHRLFCRPDAYVSPNWQCMSSNTYSSEDKSLSGGIVSWSTAWCGKDSCCLFTSTDAGTCSVTGPCAE